MNSKYVPTSESPIEMRLGYLIEECGEVLAAAGKSLRWGLDSVNPDLPLEEQETNAAWLFREIEDLKRAIFLIQTQLFIIDTEAKERNGGNHE